MVGLGNQESGNPNAVNPDTGAAGAWQVMPANWAKWAQEAGLPGAAPMTASSQRLVVRHKLIAYFEAFGSWDNVARAWYAGPAHHGINSDRKEGGGKYPSVNGYARSVISKVGPLPCG